MTEGKRVFSRTRTGALAVVALALISAMSFTDRAGASLPGQNGKLLVGTGPVPYRAYYYPHDVAVASPGSAPQPVDPPISRQPWLARFGLNDRRIDHYNTSGNSILERNLVSGESDVLWQIMQPIDPGNGFSRSPDGRFILTTVPDLYEDCFRSCADFDPRPNPEIFLRDLRGDDSAVETIVTDSRYPTEAVFSPDGRRIAVADVNGIALFDLDGDFIRQVVYDYDTHDLNFSPDGRLIAYSEGEEEIKVATTYGTGVRRLLQRSASGIPRGPVFSPDGTRIAYTRVHDRTNEPPGIYTVDLDGNDPKPLLEEGSAGQLLDWAPARTFKIRRFDRRRQQLLVRIWNPGRLTVNGKRVAKRSRQVKIRGTARIPVVAKRGARRATVTVTFRPNGAIPKREKLTLRVR